MARYWPRLLGFGESLGLTRADAHDLAQEVLISAPRSKFVAIEGASYWSWLARLARRRAARMRSRARCSTSPRRRTTPWGGTCRRLLLESVEQMPPTNREVIARLVLGYDTNEIAAELGLEPSAVLMRVHRGRKWLRARGH